MDSLVHITQMLSTQQRADVVKIIETMDITQSVKLDGATSCSRPNSPDLVPVPTPTDPD